MRNREETAPLQTDENALISDLSTTQKRADTPEILAQKEAIERRILAGEIAAEVIVLIRQEQQIKPAPPVRKPLYRLREDGPKRPWLTGTQAFILGVVWGVFGLLIVFYLLMMGGVKH